MRKLIVLCAQRSAAERLFLARGVSLNHPKLVYVIGDGNLAAVHGVTAQTAAWVDLGGGDPDVRTYLRLRLGNALEPDAACWALKQVA